MESSSDLTAEFGQNGFVVIGGVLSGPEVETLRGFLTSALATHQRLHTREQGIRTDPNLYDAMWPDFYEANPEWFGVFCNRPVVDAMHELLGDPFVLTRDSIVHWGYFPGWHTDTTTSETRGELAHLEPHWRMLTVGIYLQTGGGLEVVTGSHSQRDPFVAERHARLAGGPTAYVKTWQPTHTYEIPMQPGDAVIFDMRLVHRAAPSQPTNASGRPCQKIAIFSRASRNVQRYIDAYSDFRMDGAGSGDRNLALLRERAALWGFDIA